MKIKLKREYIAFATALLLVGIDQLFKYFAVVFLSEKVLTFPIIKNVLHFTYIENRGAAFNMLDGKRFFLILFTFIVIAAVSWFILSGRVKSKLLLWSLTLAIGGGLGNLVDRVFRGFVVDYIDFRIINFAVFNFADCCVVVGTILIMIAILFSKENSLLYTSGKNPTKRVESDSIDDYIDIADVTFEDDTLNNEENNGEIKND